MAYFKEIVTKAVVGKGKKATSNKHSIVPSEKPDTVLGCWIINHRFDGVTQNNDIYVNGSYDVNVWYSYDNDTKTGVATGTFGYNDKMNVPVSNNLDLTKKTEVIVSSLSDPNVVNVDIKDGSIEFEVHKEMGIELIGDTKIRVNVDDNYDDYVEIIDDEVTDQVLDEIDNEVQEDYLEINEEENK